MRKAKNEQISKSAQYSPKKKRRETLHENVKRLTKMAREAISHTALPFDEIANLLLSRTIAGSQRALQFGGQAIKEKNSRLYNCTVSYCDRPEFFSEAFYLLLCGCGVGYSIQRHHVNTIPILTAPENTYAHTIPDNIEGWADAILALISADTSGGSLPLFDFSEVREKGSTLRHGGKAPGPEPLRRAISKIHAILEDCVWESLRPIDCFDITCHLADAVLSGGVRRSATIAIFSLDAEELRLSKPGTWFNDTPHRGRANISAFVPDNAHFDDFAALFDSTKQFGEPGFIFGASSEHLNNPCVEITMCPTLITLNDEVVQEYTLDLIDPEMRSFYESKGYVYESGWQMCNLCTINCARIQTDDEFVHAAKHAAILGTIQASFTQFNYLPPVTQRIVQRESLLGISMTGILSHPRFQDPALLSRAVAAIHAQNIRVSELLSIPQASRLTCVKPEGTASLFLGASAGIHPYHSRAYIRRVQISDTEPLFELISQRAPQMVEKSVWSDGHVISFALEAPPNAMIRSDLTALEHLEIARHINVEWVRRGTAIPTRLEDAHHNVSITVSVSTGEWNQVRDYLWEHRALFTGVSLLPSSGDYVYEQAPYQEISLPHSSDPLYQKKMDALRKYIEIRDIPPFDLTVEEEEDHTQRAQAMACAGGKCDL